MTKREITIVIPVYNEKENVENTVRVLRAELANLSNKYKFKILFSDNCSTDGTFEIIKKIAKDDADIVAIKLARNYGFQKSLLTAYRHVKSDAAIQMDCDLQDPPSVIPSFIEQWERGHDVVVGIREARDENFMLQKFRQTYYWLVNQISTTTTIDNAGDFRLVDRKVLNRLNDITDSNPYTRGLISSLATNETGVPYARPRRVFGHSKFPILKLFPLAIDGLVSNSLMPLRCAVWFGLLLFVFAGFLFFYFIYNHFFGENSWPKGYASIIVLLTLSMAANSILVGVVGEYVGRIFDEVRVRPLTIVAETINSPLPGENKIKNG